MLLFGMAFSMAVHMSYAEETALEHYGLSLCNNSQYRCMSVKPGATWADVLPDPKVRDIIMRLNRTNVSLMYRTWLVLPKDISNLNYMNLSPMPRHITPPGEPMIFVDLGVFAFGAYDTKGDLVYWGPAAGGQNWCDDIHQNCQSAAGVFRVYRKEGADCMSSKFPVQTKGGASMPYCMFYYKGFAIHGSTLIGFADRSKGCVRLFYDDAKWLSQNFVKVGTKVMVNRPMTPPTTAQDGSQPGQQPQQQPAVAADSNATQPQQVVSGDSNNQVH